MKVRTNRNEDHFPTAWLDLENECFWAWGIKTDKKMREAVEECIFGWRPRNTGRLGGRPQGGGF